MSYIDSIATAAGRQGGFEMLVNDGWLRGDNDDTQSLVRLLLYANGSTSKD